MAGILAMFVEFERNFLGSHKSWNCQIKNREQKKPGEIINSSGKSLLKKMWKTKADCTLRILQNYQKTLHKPKSPPVFSALLEAGLPIAMEQNHTIFPESILIYHSGKSVEGFLNSRKPFLFNPSSILK
jgi:hypothetical protein